MAALLAVLVFAAKSYCLNLFFEEIVKAAEQHAGLWQSIASHCRKGNRPAATFPTVAFVQWLKGRRQGTAARRRWPLSRWRRGGWLAAWRLEQNSQRARGFRFTARHISCRPSLAVPATHWLLFVERQRCAVAHGVPAAAPLLSKLCCQKTCCRLATEAFCVNARVPPVTVGLLPATP